MIIIGRVAHSSPLLAWSGAVPLQDTAFPLPSRAFSRSTHIQSLPVLRSLSRTAENCSIPSPPHARTTLASPDCDECSATSPRTAGDFER